MNISIETPKISDEYRDAFWYNGIIATATLKDGSKLELIATGEKRYMFEPDGCWFKGEQAVDKAHSLLLNDESLALLNDHDGIGMSNWFEIVHDTIDLEGAIFQDYNEALSELETFADMIEKGEIK